MTYKVLEATPERWRKAYVAVAGNADDIVLAGNESDGYFFTAADGAYATDASTRVADYILNQPWSFTVSDVNAKGDEADETYFKIGERLYELPH